MDGSVGVKVENRWVGGWSVREIVVDMSVTEKGENQSVRERESVRETHKWSSRLNKTKDKLVQTLKALNLTASSGKVDFCLGVNREDQSIDYHIFNNEKLFLHV